METREERFFAKTMPEPNSGCWFWMGAIGVGGYGNFWSGTRYINAHRWSYETAIGPIPKGFDLDHKCRVRSCCNPMHLEPVTRSENLRRSPLMGGNSRKTHCKRGHALEGGNLILKNDGKRNCRECARAYGRAWKRNFRK